MSLEEGQSGFTLRAGLIAIVITMFLVTTSSYIALKVGALPWPIIFSVIISGAVLKGLSHFSRKTSIHEMNVAQAGGTIGGLVASGVVFTIPGILYLQQQNGGEIPLPNPWLLSLLCITAGVLGVLLSIPVRALFVDREKLPYPSGTAGAEALKASESMGKHAFYITVALTLTGIFVLLSRPYLATGITIPFVPSIGYSIIVMPMPLYISVGYILGHKSALNSWFLGTVLGWFILIPVLGVLYNVQTIAGSRIVKDIGLGIVLGSGTGYFFSYVLPQAKQLFTSLVSKGDTSLFVKSLPVVSFVALLVLVFIGISPFAAIIAVAGTWVMVTVAGLITGRTNLDPLEQFGILVALFIQGVFALFQSSLDYLQLFYDRMFRSYRFGSGW